MKAVKVMLENFRGYYGKCDISLSDFTAFIGRNDAGKSSVLEALDIFFHDGKGTVKIDKEDLNIIAKREGEDSFRIGVEFSGYPQEVIIDETNPTRLDKEYLLNSNNNLEVWKTYKNGKLQSTAIRCKHPVNDETIKSLLTMKASELQKIIREHDIHCSDMRKSAELRDAIRTFYASRDGLEFREIDIVVDREDAKKIWEKLQSYMPQYALFHADRKNLDQDNEVQDPLKVAIRRIFAEHDVQEQLNSIANRVEEEITAIAEDTLKYFKDFAKDSAINLYPDIPRSEALNWAGVYKGIGFYADEVPLNKRGSGLRRLVLLSFFRTEVDRLRTDRDSTTTTIYAIEEPETSLHPDLQKKLLSELASLSENDGVQVIITTHSPALLRLLSVDSIRYVEADEGYSKVVNNLDDDTIHKIVKDMGLLPEILKTVICVEGETDEQFLLNINQNIPELKEIINLETAIESGLVSIIPMRGSNLKDWISRYILRNTGIVEFHLYDRDGDGQYQEDIDRVNNRDDGSYGVLTRKREIENYIPEVL